MSEALPKMRNVSSQWPHVVSSLFEQLHSRCSKHKDFPDDIWNELMGHLDECLMTDERIMREYNSGRKAGIKNASEAVEKCLLDTAADIFKSGKNDEHAKLLRSVAAGVKKHVADIS